MGDFKKQPTPPPVTDDHSPVPTIGTFNVAPELGDAAADQQADEKETNRRAAPYFHPAWETVQEKLEEALERYDGNNVLQYKDLPAAEFQVKVLAHQVIREEIKDIIKDVQDAVEQVESRPKRGTKSGAGGE